MNLWKWLGLTRGGAVKRAIDADAALARRFQPGPPSVDRSARELTDGSPVPADNSHTAKRGDGQQKGYVVLSEAERAKGFVRPFRDTYRHVGSRPLYPTRPLTPSEAERHADLGFVAFEPFPSGQPSVGRYWTQAQLNSGCGATTTMGRALAETYARDPAFYGGTFCAACGDHFKVGLRGEFVWETDGMRVGT